jgi:hypothetical protein
MFNVFDFGPNGWLKKATATALSNGRRQWSTSANQFARNTFVMMGFVNSDIDSHQPQALSVIVDANGRFESMSIDCVPIQFVLVFLEQPAPFVSQNHPIVPPNICFQRPNICSHSECFGVWCGGGVLAEI